MVLIQCYECSREISDKAPNCPHCGAPSVYVVVGSQGPTEPTARNLDDLIEQGGTFLDPETMRPYSGPVFSLFPNQPALLGTKRPRKVRRMGALLDGRWHGPYETHHKDGRLRSKGKYDNGIYSPEWFDHVRG